LDHMIDIPSMVIARLSPEVRRYHFQQGVRPPDQNPHGTRRGE
jgi:hypothetical protein